MNRKNLFFIIKKSIFRNKFHSFMSIALITVIIIMIQMVAGVTGFFNTYSQKTQSNFIDLRKCSVTCREGYSADDVIAMFENEDCVDIIVYQEEYNTNLTYRDESGNYYLYAAVRSEDSMPDIVSGRALDSDSVNEIIIPHRFELCDQKNGKSVFIDGSSLIGKELKCSMECFDYNWFIDEAANEATNIRYLGQSQISLKVVGTYDNEKHFSESTQGYVSVKTARTIHSADVKSRNEYVLTVIADTIEDLSKIQKIAKDNKLEISVAIDSGTSRITAFCIAGYIIIFILLGVGIFICGLSAKLDARKNISGYVFMKNYGYKLKDIYKTVFGKYLMFYLVSLLISIPFTLILLGRVNSFFQSNENMGGSSIHMTVPVFLITCCVCFLPVLYMTGWFCYYVSETKVSDICKDT